MSLVNPENNFQVQLILSCFESDVKLVRPWNIQMRYGREFLLFLGVATVHALDKLLGVVLKKYFIRQKKPGFQKNQAFQI
jgi:hypothetical protein